MLQLFGRGVVWLWSEKAAKQCSDLITNRTRLNKRSRAHAYTSRLVTVAAGYNFHIKVQLKGSKQGVIRGFYNSLVRRFNSRDINGPNQAVNEHVTPYSTVSIGNKGRTLHRSLFGPTPVDSAAKRLQHMDRSRSSALL